MPSWLPSFPYPAGGNGFWNPVTSTINWCEEDYYATRYAAEIVNSFTNAIFIFLAIKGIRSCRKNDHDTIFLIAFWGYLLVGSGSFLFHATLTYPMQLVDELSMIYTTCLMFFAVFSHGQSRKFAIYLGGSLAALALFITLYYHYLQDPTFHQNMYALLTAIVLLRSMWIMEVGMRPCLRKKRLAGVSIAQNGLLLISSPEEERRRDVRDAEILRNMWWMVGYGLSIFLGGFALWNVDNEFCSLLRSWRREIGLPWGILLEGHGWWHLMTGIGAYHMLLWGVWLRHCLNGKQDQYRLEWPRLMTSLPDLIRQPSSAPRLPNGAVQDGTTKKPLQSPIETSYKL